MIFPEIDAMVDDIKNDKISGSSIIALRASECLDNFAGEVLTNHQEMLPKEFISELKVLGRRLIFAQPTMAAVLNGINDIITSVLDSIEGSIGGSDLNEEDGLKLLCTKTQASSRKFILELKLAQETIANSYSDILEENDRIMTISASGSVEILLTTAHDSSIPISVYLPESRPMFEGRQLAQRLAKSGIDCKLIADHAMFHYLTECTKVIVGADRVMPNGILNKIGTYGLALAASEKHIPFYCACECFKFVPDIIPLDQLNPLQPESQLYYPSKGEDIPETLEVKNIFFDFTELKYITGFLTDCGMMDSKQLMDYIDNVKILPGLIEGLQ